MDDHFELNRLLDCYGALLTERKRNLLEQYVQEDCSLFEIAERENISRQAVHDAVMSAKEQLAGYEAAINAVKTSDKLLLGLTELETLVGGNAQAERKIVELKDICEDIYGI